MDAILYGRPPLGLAEQTGQQTSPLVPGSADLTSLAEGSVDSATVLAPPGVLERRWVLAQALRVLKPGGELTALAPKDKGGSRLGKELKAFGCEVVESGKAHHRICLTARPAAPEGIHAAIKAGGPQRVEALAGLWSQPGVFSWDRVDPGTALLMQHLPKLSGAGADLGCGVGVLARAVLRSPGVTALTLIDIDRRAVDAARRNVEDARARFVQVDVRTEAPADLNFVVMNPPFHDAGHETRDLGVAFIQKAAAALKKGGVLWLVANRHMPYEAPLAAAFARVKPVVDTGGYKVIEAIK